MAKTGFHLSIKKLLLLGFLFVVLLVIPLTVYLVQQQQETRSQATPNTTMAFNPNAATAQVGDDVSFDIMLTPGNNQVSFVKLVIKFDPTKLKATNDSFLVDPNSNLAVLQGPVVGTDTISVSLQLSGIDTTKVIRTQTKIGTITFNVIDGPAENSQITFSPATEIRSINGDSDAFNENVFLSGSPASITITDGDGTDDLSPSPTIGQTDGSGDNEAPVCNNLTLTGPATGEAPYEVGLIVNGSDSDGTLRNFKFTFDDNEVENIASTSSEAKNTATVTSSMYTYETADTYTVTAVITDDKGGTSDSVACTKTITVTDADGGSDDDNSENNSLNTTSTDDDDSDGTGSTDTTSTDDSNSTETTTTDDSNDDSSELTTAEESPSPMPATGPTETIMGIGVLGGILLLIGTLLFFAL